MKEIIIRDLKGNYLDVTKLNKKLDQGCRDALGYDSFSEDESYSVGRIVFKDGKLYKFTSAKSAGAWDSTKVTQTSIDEIKITNPDNPVSGQVLGYGNNGPEWKNVTGATVDTEFSMTSTNPVQNKVITEQLLQMNEAYGVRHAYNFSDPKLERIGNLALHVSLPIQSQMRRCILNDSGVVQCYLDANDSTKTVDGETANLTGVLDENNPDRPYGQVMVEVPAHYRKHTLDETNGYYDTLISLFPMQGSIYVPKYYVSAYQATVDRTNSSSPKLSSVVNNTAQYRGGGNQSSWDTLSKSQLGMPATYIALNNFRTYARNRGSKWNELEYFFKMDYWWLYLVEYANLNCQNEFNSTPTSEGYKRGGLGMGVTTLETSKWDTFNDKHPLVKCGCTNSLGNNTGVVSYAIPADYYGTYYDYDSTVGYTTGQYVRDTTTLLMYCRLSADSGTSGYALTDSSHWKIAYVQVPSYRGIENPFGHIWEWNDGILFVGQTDHQDCYVAKKRSQYANAVTNYEYRGDRIGTNSYAKTSVKNKYGDYIPTEVGGGSASYFCDSCNYLCNQGSIYALCSGGRANSGVAAGFGGAYVSLGVSSPTSHFGSRLCWSDADDIFVEFN